MSGDTVIGASIGRAGLALSDSTPATVAHMVPTTHEIYNFDFGKRNEGTAEAVSSRATSPLVPTRMFGTPVAAASGQATATNTPSTPSHFLTGEEDSADEDGNEDGNDEDAEDTHRTC